jgi:hypothetical protein
LNYPQFIRAFFPSTVAVLIFLAIVSPARSQSFPLTVARSSADLPSAPGPASNVAPPLPAVPEPAPRQNPIEPYPTNLYYPFLSRMGIGADVSPLGIGIKGAVILNTFFEARLMQNFFSYTSGRLEVDNINFNANLHLRSTAAAFDWYPWHSVWRFSVGALFLNGNQINATTRIASGTSIDIDHQTFYSANPNPATGATPLTGSGAIGFHAHSPALTLSGGFGRFIPRSERHWSFPSEFGVAFTGPPTVNLNVAGWACLDKAQTQCSNVGDAANPIAIQFNNAVQNRLARARTSLSAIQIYPLFSYSAVYSFNIR